jgi:hypothetical protein
VQIRPHKRLSDDDILLLAERLVSEGHFNPGESGNEEEIGPRDFGWVPGLYGTITERDIDIPRGTARLIDFSRTPPEGLP